MQELSRAWPRTQPGSPPALRNWWLRLPCPTTAQTSLAFPGKVYQGTFVFLYISALRSLNFSCLDLRLRKLSYHKLNSLILYVVI